jgi:gluconate kinase
MTADEVAAVASARTLPTTVTPAQRVALANVVAALKQGNTAKGNQLWTEFCKSYFDSRGKAAGVNDFVLYVLYESYLVMNAMLNEYAQRVAYFNQHKQAVREHVSALRRRRTEALQRQLPSISVPVLSLTPRFQLNAPAIQSRGTSYMKPDQIQSEIAAWQAKLNQIAHDAELANIDLQNALQRQQQVLQMLSNVSKMLRDTATAVISNIRG